MSTIYMTKEVNVDTDVEVEIELEMHEVVDGNEEEVIEYLLGNGYRDEVIDAVEDDIIDNDKFIERVKTRHNLLTEEEAKEKFHVEQSERGKFYFGSNIAFRDNENGVIADTFKLHDDRYAVRIRDMHGGGYFVADEATAVRLLSLFPPPTGE